MGGPIALVRDGDRIVIDAREHRLDVELAEGELAKRRDAWSAPSAPVSTGVLGKFVRLVRSASEGCVTD